MTREDQICNAASSYYYRTDSDNECFNPSREDGFIAGAHWADKNKCLVCRDECEENKAATEYISKLPEYADYEMPHESEYNAFCAGIAYADAYPKSQWIDAEKELPRDFEDVLVVTNYGNHDEYHVARYNQGGFWQCSDCSIIEEGVYKWMHLPKLR